MGLATEERKLWNRMARPGLVLGLVVLMSMSACSGGSGPPTAGGPVGRVGRPGGGVGMGGSTTVPIRRSFGQEIALPVVGLKIALAQELLDARTNPFLSKLPKINVVLNAGGSSDSTATVTAPVADPFEGLTLLGVVVNPKQSMALLSVGGETQMLKGGEVFSSGVSQLKIGKITLDSADIQTVGNGSQKKTLSIPDIIGFQSADSAGGGAGEGSAADSSEKPESGKSLLDNLNSIIDGSGSAGASRNTPSGSGQKTP